MFWNKLTFLFLAVVICTAGIVMDSPLALLLGMLLVAFAFQKLPDAFPLPVAGIGSFLFYAILILSLAGSGLAAILSAQRNFRFNTFDTGLWLASVLLIAGAAVWHDRQHRLPVEQPLHQDRPQRWGVFLEVGFVALMTLMALGLRVYDLASLPPMVHGDEGEVGMLALRVLTGEEPLPIFASTIFGQNPAGFPYLLAPFLALFGRNEVGLRMLPAVFGTAAVPILYLIGRRGWGILAGAVAAWLMTVSHLHIHYSRIAVPNIANASIVVLMIWLLFRAYQANVSFLGASSTLPEESQGTSSGQSSRPWLAAPLADFVGVGLVIGLGQYFYHGARILPIIAGVAFLFLLLKRKISYLQILVVGLAAVVAVAPLATFYLDHWVEFSGRSTDVFIFSEENLRHTMGADATFADDLLPYLTHQFVTTLGFFTGQGDRSSFYVMEIPAFDPLTLVLLWLGFGVLLTRLRHFEDSVVAVWFLLGVLFAGFLTIDQPNGPRLVSAVPAIYLIGGIFVQRVWALLPAARRQHMRWAAPVLGGLALITLYLNWQTYFVSLKGYAHPILSTVVARAVADAPTASAVYLIGDPILYAEHGTIRFLAGTENIFDLRTPVELSTLSESSTGIFIVALEPRLADLETIAEQYPGGDFQSYADGHGRFLYATYYLPPAL